MALTKIKIANIALDYLRAESINSTEDETTEARALATHWDAVVESELQKHTWDFAQKRINLNRLTETPVFGYKYKYALPNDFLRVVKIEGSADYRREGNTLVTNDEAVEMVYVYRNTDVSTWPPYFAMLVAAQLRIALANSISADKSMIELATAIYDKQAAEARWIDSSMDYQDDFGQFQSSLITERYV